MKSSTVSSDRKLFLRAKDFRLLFEFSNSPSERANNPFFLSLLYPKSKIYSEVLIANAFFRLLAPSTSTLLLYSKRVLM